MDMVALIASSTSSALLLTVIFIFIFLCTTFLLIHFREILHHDQVGNWCDRMYQRLSWRHWDVSTKIASGLKLPFIHEMLSYHCRFLFLEHWHQWQRGSFLLLGRAWATWWWWQWWFGHGLDLVLRRRLCVRRVWGLVPLLYRESVVQLTLVCWRWNVVAVLHGWQEAEVQLELNAPIGWKFFSHFVN